MTRTRSFPGWRRAAVLLAAACLFLTPAGPRASGGRIPVCAPTVISAPGSYYLTRDIFAAAGVVIDIQADHVVLDLNGHSIVNASSALGANCVQALNHTDVHVTNGVIRWGYDGVFLYCGGGTFQVDNLTIIGPADQGIVVSGTGSSSLVRATVRRNQVIGTSGSHGIQLWYGDASTLAENTVRNATGGNGIYVNLSKRSSVTDNTCLSNSSSGIKLESSSEIKVSQNTCSSNAASGLYFLSSYNCTADWNVLAGNSTGFTVSGGGRIVWAFNHTPHGPGGIGWAFAPAGAVVDGGGNYE